MTNLLLCTLKIKLYSLIHDCTFHKYLLNKLLLSSNVHPMGIKYYVLHTQLPLLKIHCLYTEEGGKL